MTDNNGARHYPNLAACKVVVRSTTSSLKDPVKLPRDCLDAVQNKFIPKPHDFSLERSVLKQKEQRATDLTVVKADSREELQRAVLFKMKAVTKADEGVCVALLEENNYDVKTSIEAFFQAS